MSKMSELAAGLKELRQCGEKIVGVADALTTGATELRRCGEVLNSISDSLVELFSSPDEKAPEAIPEKTEVPAAENHLELLDVRKLLSAKSRAGYTAEVKQLLRKYGAEKLSDIRPEDYAALVAEAEVIGNA